MIFKFNIPHLMIPLTGICIKRNAIHKAVNASPELQAITNGSNEWEVAYNDTFISATKEFITFSIEGICQQKIEEG